MNNVIVFLVLSFTFAAAAFCCGFILGSYKGFREGQQFAAINILLPELKKSQESIKEILNEENNTRISV